MTRAAWTVAALSILVALAFVLVFVAGTTLVRWPYFGEAETIFEAARLRSGFPLFVDPLVGAREYGTPFSRYFVTYPPIFTALVALFPASFALVGARIVSCLAWFGGLGGLVATARKDCRTNALAGAAFVAGLWILVNFAAVGRPDAPACALAAIGLARALRKGRIDGLATTLLVLATFTKPSLFGLPTGALLAEALHRRKIGGLARATLVAAVIVAILWLATRGQLFTHSFRSMAQPFSWANWLDTFPSRAPFFFPLFALAGWMAWQRRSEPAAAIGLGALTVSTAWIIVTLAKIGSAANYWMEPSIAAVAVLGHVPGSYRFGASGPKAAVLTAACVIYADVAAIDGSVTWLARYRRESAFLATARQTCGAGPNDVIASDVSGIELALNGRILEPAYQMTHLALSGGYSADVWLEDLRAPNVRCYVRASHLLDALPPIASYVATSFTPVAKEDDLELLRRKPE